MYNVHMQSVNDSGRRTNKVCSLKVHCVPNNYAMAPLWIHFEIIRSRSSAANGASWIHLARQ